jgi:hypothetical protein
LRQIPVRGLFRSVLLTRSLPVCRLDITLTCTNPVAGTPGGAPETNYEFRERVWEAQMSTVQGYPGFIRQKLTDLSNVQARLVSVVQSGNAWIVMCGGGDIYEMAGAIYKSAGDISRLKGQT